MAGPEEVDGSGGMHGWREFSAREGRSMEKKEERAGAGLERQGDKEEILAE